MSGRTTNLLQTKFQRPRVPRHFVPRPRLFERLDQGSQGPLTLVCAAAGYGKTTLVSSWIENQNAESQAPTREPVAWLSLDERDSDLALFLRYLIAALRTMFPDACAATSSLLQATRPPPLDVLSATLINEIAALPQDFLLVLDNYHLVTGEAVSNLFNELMRHWPQPMHLVLLSRYVPALSLAPLRAKGQLVEVRARDLQFTRDEAATYLEQSLGPRLSPRAVELLEQRVEGWIAGLQLASLSLQGAADPEAALVDLSGLDAGFAEYLADDVLSRQPAAIQSFLLQTAVLDHFCVSLCEAVVTSADPEWNAARCIDWVERRSLFVSVLDSRKEWYEYHHLFRSMLRKHALGRGSLGDLGPDFVSALQRRAAAWFAERDQVEEAMRYALAAGDPELAARFTARGLRGVLNREDRPTLDRWLGLFGEGFVQVHLELLVVRGYSLLLSWQIGPLAGVLRRIEGLLEPGRNTAEGAAGDGVDLQAMRGCVSVLSAFVALLGNDHLTAEVWSREALFLLPEPWLFPRSGGVLFQALALQGSGQWQAAEQLLVEGYEGLVDRTSVFALRHLQGLYMIYYRQAGDLEQVSQIGEKLAEMAGKSRLRLLQSWGYHGAGLAHYQRNELSVARECFTRLLEFRYTGNIGALRDGVQRLALIHELAGEHDDALAMVRILSEIDVDQAGREGDETRALRARLSLMRGDLAGAARWADDFTEPVPIQAWLWNDPPHLVKARILATRGTAADLQAALEILETLGEVAASSYNNRLLIEVLALRALALAAVGRAGAAREALLAAIDLARPGGFVRAFLDLGARMESLLEQLAGREECSNRDAVLSILAEFSKGPPARAAATRVEGQPHVHSPTSAVRAGQQPLIEPLTPREIELLMLLRDPLSLKEAARQLSISYQTVKRHTVNIYGKLEVNKRWAAVAKAQALGLIPER